VVSRAALSGSKWEIAPFGVLGDSPVQNAPTFHLPQLPKSSYSSFALRFLTTTDWVDGKEKQSLCLTGGVVPTYD
jgi:hypothetical protein